MEQPSPLFINNLKEYEMYLKQQEGHILMLNEIRLCCVCTRMFNRNLVPHAMATANGMLLFSHLVCPPLKQEYLGLEKPK